MSAEWLIETDLPRCEIEEFLRQHAPWRTNVRFSNGLQSFDFGKTEPANDRPLGKLNMIRSAVPAAALAGDVLDIGHNIGYNSVALATQHGAKVVGIDYNPRHQIVARWLAAAAGATASFAQGDAETWVRPGCFDFVLHFGTLYHLRNPLLSIQTAIENLRPGGYLALETVAYVGPGAERNLNKWIYGFNGDKTNYWALAKPTIEEVLAVAGAADIRLLREAAMPIYDGEMSRVVYLARKQWRPALGPSS